jgi:large subunit ribosomal protein L33
MVFTPHEVLSEVLSFPFYGVLLQLGQLIMAKVAKEGVHLVSSAGTGFFYTVRRNKKRSKGAASKLSVRKYDPSAQKHVLFEEKKLSKLKKKFVKEVNKEVKEQAAE